MTCTVIFVPGVIVVLGRGNPMLILCANTAETANEAKVRNDASFIIGFEREGRKGVMDMGGSAGSRKYPGLNDTGYRVIAEPFIRS
jgi:hypothetical protein